MGGKTTIVNEYGVPVDVNSSNELKVALSSDVQIGAVEIKNASDDTRAVVKTDGTDNALCIYSNDLDVRDLSYNSDSVEVLQDTASDLKARVEQMDECQRILTSDDAVTTINYTDSNKDSVSNIVTSSSTLSRKVTDTYDNSGATTLVITRAVADV